MFKNLFKSKLTPWIPFGVYTYASSHFMVFVRKNKNTQMLYFKTKEVQKGTSYHNIFIPRELIDVCKAWDVITSS